MNEAGHGSIFFITSVGLLLRFVDSARVGRCHHVRCDVELGVPVSRLGDHGLKPK